MSEPGINLAPETSLSQPIVPQPLTGGSVGPEASIFTPLTLLLVAIVFTRFYRENRYNPLGNEPATRSAV
jgi:hypothetical protein